MRYQRRFECGRCGQCCGVDDKECWPVEWPERLDRMDPHELEMTFPVIALVGIPSHGALQHGTVTVDGVTYDYCWHKDGGLRKSKDDNKCPFLVHDEENGPWLCGLVGTTEEWRWEQQCRPWPRPNMSDHDMRQYIEEYPKCSYGWRLID